jgi:DNA-binding transcriptional MerR regulator
MMSEPETSETYSLTLVRITGNRPASYSLEAAASLAGIHPEMLRYYCRRGFFGEARERSQTDPVFDDDSLYELRRLEHYRRLHGVNRKTLRLLCDLWREVERLRIEVGFRRDR